MIRSPILAATLLALTALAVVASPAKRPGWEVHETAIPYLELIDRVKAATDHELEVQNRLRVTEDFKEGVAAMTERRIPNWQGR